MIDNTVEKLGFKFRWLVVRLMYSLLDGVVESLNSIRFKVSCHSASVMNLGVFLKRFKPMNFSF
jgi:hypothetical protein